MGKLRTIKDLGKLKGKKVLLRVDLNVPMQDGTVVDHSRILGIKETVAHLKSAGATIILMSHFGRPEGQPVIGLSLSQIVPALEQGLGAKVTFAGDALAKETKTKIKNSKDICLLENLRFHPGEEANDADFAKKLSILGDVYINDAFSSSHRAHVSTVGITHHLPSAAGLGLVKEIEALTTALENPRHPVAAVIGGAKISTKISVLQNLIVKMDHILIGGGMANTFLAAQGKKIGASLNEPDLESVAITIMENAVAANCKIHLPDEVSVAKHFNATDKAIGLPLDAVEDDDMILDIGPKASEGFIKVLRRCKTVLWNGPLGAFEIKPFDRGTNQVAEAVGNFTKKGKMISVAGGGDTVAALYHANAKGNFTYVSTAGGAFLEWLEGKTLPGIAALML
ncbi:MAG: phosphoglycerate kinase [Sphingomonadales bacterium]